MMTHGTNDIWKKRFALLERGKGYYPENLAEQWGVGTGTVKSRAKRAGAIRYVEMNGEVIEIVTHPETKRC